MIAQKPKVLMRDFMEQQGTLLCASIASSLDSFTLSCRNRSRSKRVVFTCRAAGREKSAVNSREPQQALSAAETRLHQTVSTTDLSLQLQAHTTSASIRGCIHVRQSEWAELTWLQDNKEKSPRLFICSTSWFFTDFWLIGNDRSTLLRSERCFLECFFPETDKQPWESSYNICPPFQKGVKHTSSCVH